MSTRDCPAPEQLKAFALGEIGDGDAAPIAKHLDQCAHCAETIDRLPEATDVLIASLRQPAQPGQFEADSQCQQALDRVKQYGHEASFTTEPGGPRPVDAGNSPPPLRQLRDYQLLEKLGEGGMGAVYKARHERLDKLVAIKVLPAERMQDADAVARFQREMRAVGHLEHPNIVRAMDAGEVDGMHFLVMEYVEGVDLSQLVKQRGPLPIADACELIRQAAVGLDEAHENGMVHRDIKPSNIMLCIAGKRKPPVVKILDMGLALLSDAHVPGTRELTSTGQMMGTLDYMAPEQGGDSKTVDIRADIYSLGASLYRLLTGQVIYYGAKFQAPVQKLMALAVEPAPPIQSRRTGIPDDLAAIVHRMLEKEPGQRFATPKDVAEALAPFCTGADLAVLLQVDAQPPAADADTSLSGTAPHLASSEVATDAAGRPVVPAAAPIATRPAVGRASRKPVAVAVLAAAAALLAGVVFYIATNKGTIRVEVTDPAIEVALGSNGLKITPTDGQGQIDVSPGDHTLRVKRGELEFESEKLVLKRGQTEQLRVEFVAGTLALTKADGKPLGSKAEAVRANTVVDVATTQPAAAAVAPIVKEYCLEFNGKDSYVEIASLERGSLEPLTVEFWMHPKDSVINGESIICSNGHSYFALNYSSAWWVFGHALRKAADSSVVDYHGLAQCFPRTTDWSHVAYVFDRAAEGFESRIYQNGRLAARKNTPPGLVAEAYQGRVFLGAPREGDGSTRFFQGRLREVHLSKIGRYQENFTPPSRIEPDEHTLALYRCDEGQGDVLHDSSMHKRDGKIVRAAWGLKDPPPPPTNYALYLQGQQHVEIPTLKLEPGADFTIEAWARSTAPVDARPRSIVRFGDQATLANATSPAQWQFALRDPDVYAAAGADQQLPFPVHLAAVLQRQTMRLFVGGKLVETTEIGGRLAAIQPGRIAIGGMPGLDDFFQGVIDEVRISKRARYEKDFAPADRWEPDADTLALYHCDEGTGLRLADSSGNGHHGRLVGVKWVEADGREAVSLPPVAEEASLLARAEDVMKWQQQHTVLRFDDGDCILSVHPSVNHQGVLYYTGKDRIAKDFEASFLLQVRGDAEGASLNFRIQDDPAGSRCTFGSNPGIPWGSFLGGSPVVHSKPRPDAFSAVRRHGFNAVMVRCVGKRVTYTINGVVAQDGEFNIPLAGRMAFFVLPSVRELRIRDFRLIDLTDSSTAMPSVANSRPVGPVANHALHFTGKQMVEIPTLKLPAGGDVTLEAWVRSAIDSGDKPGTILHFGQGTLRNNPQTSQWEFSLDAPERFTAVAPNKNVPLPVHVAAVFKGQALRLFVDGTLVETTETSAKLSAIDEGLSIGGVPGTDDFFRGVIDEVRVSKTARYDKDFQPLRRWEPDADTLALYHSDEGSGIRLTDSSGNNHHGKIAAAKWVKADGREAVSLPPQKDPDPLLAFPQTWTGFGALEDGDWVMRDLKGSANLTWVQGPLIGVLRDYEISFLIRASGAGSSDFLISSRDRAVYFDPATDRGWGRIAELKLPANRQRTVRRNDFNAVTLRCMGKRITVHVNGAMVQDAELDLPSTGDLSWLVHAPMQEFRLRDVQVTRLSPPAFSLSPEKPPFERALEFDGKQSYVNIPSLDIPAGPVTLETWVLRKPGADEVLMSSRAREYAALYYYDGTLAQWISSPERAVNAAASPEHLGVGRFAHVAGVWDGKECRVYLNGKRVSYGNTNHPGTEIALGRAVTLLGADFELPIVDQLKTRRHFHGQMAAARFSKSARYKDDFEPPLRFESDADTLALYHFDEGAGDQLKDSSGNNHHGQIVGAKWVKLDGK